MRSGRSTLIRGRSRHAAALLLLLLLAGCAAPRTAIDLQDFAPSGRFGERMRVLKLYPGVTATIVAPAHLDAQQRVDLILYALPNGNSTAETIGRTFGDGVGWRYVIQYIGAQTRALRSRGLSQAIVVYLEADSKSWPEWRRRHGFERANARIVTMLDDLPAAVGNPPQRMLADMRGSLALTADRVGEFLRYGHAQVDILLHPNPENCILHIVMIGEMNGYLHAMLTRRSNYERGNTVLRPDRVYQHLIDGMD